MDKAGRRAGLVGVDGLDARTGLALHLLRVHHRRPPRGVQLHADPRVQVQAPSDNNNNDRDNIIRRGGMILIIIMKVTVMITRIK